MEEMISNTSNLLIKDLSAEEFKSLIFNIVKEALENEMEDIFALNSNNYLNSIHKARTDYKSGKIKTFDELFPDA